MSKKIIRYSALTIGKHGGKTYWGTPKESLSELKEHLNRYINRPCDILIYAHYSSILSKCVEQHWNVEPAWDEIVDNEGNFVTFKKIKNLFGEEKNNA